MKLTEMLGQYEELLDKKDQLAKDTKDNNAAIDKLKAEIAEMMIDEDIPCEDVLSQINAAKSALHGCGKVVLEGHIQHCVRDGIAHGDADKTIESFTKAVERFANMT